MSSWDHHQMRSTGNSFTDEEDSSSLTSELVPSLYSENVTIQLEATQKIRKRLWEAPNQLGEKLIKLGTVPRFVHFLQNSRYPALQFESACVLISITFGNIAQTQVIIDAGVVPLLIRLISSSNETVVERSIWALGNFACDSTEYRDLILNSNVLPPLLGLFNGRASLSLMRMATFALRNLCCHTNPPANFAQVSQCLRVLSDLIWSQDEEVLQHVCYALSGLCDGSNKVDYKHIQVVIESGVCLRAVQLLSHTSNDVVLGALDLVCHITTGTDSQTRVLINENALPVLFNLLFHEKDSIVEKACLIVANITATNEQQIQALIDNNLIHPLIEFLHHRDLQIRQHAARSLANTTAKGSDEQVAYIVEAGAISSLCEVLSETDSDLTEIVLTCIESMLITGELLEKTAGSTENPYAVLICNFPEMKLALDSEDTAMQLKATKRIGKLLGTPGGLNLLIDEVIKMGAVPRFVHFLEDSTYPELQFKSAWVLNNIASGNFTQSQIVIDAGAVPVLIKLISSSDETVVKYSVSALGNIARHSTECRDLVLNSNVLPALLGLFNSSNLSTSIMRTLTWTLTSLCGNIPPPSFEQVSSCLPLLARLMVNEDEDTDVLEYVCWALSHLCAGPDLIKVIIDSGVCPRAVQLLSHSSTDLVKEALGLVRSIVRGNDLQTQVLLNENVLPALGSLLSHEMESILVYACQTLAKFFVCSNEQIQAFDSGVCLRAIQLLSHASTNVVKAALDLVMNITAGDKSQAKVLIKENALPALCSLLSHEKESILEYVCWILGKLIVGSNELIQIVIESGVCPRAVQLLSHTSADVVFEALGLVCSITAGGVSPIQVIINSNALPALGRLLSHEKESIVENACRTLANITDVNDHIQALIDANILPSLIALLHHRDVSTSMMPFAIFTLSRLYNNLHPSFAQVSPCLPLLARLMFNEDENILANVCWVLSSLCLGSNEQIQVEQIQVIIEFGVCPRAIQLLSHTSTNVMKEAIHLVGKIALGDDSQTQVLINENVLPALSCLLSHEKESILVYACWALANICSIDLIQVVIDSGVCPRAVQLLSHTSNDVVFEALGLVCNIATGDESQTQVLINENVLPVLGCLLSHERISIVKNACRTLANISLGSEQQIQSLIDGNMIPSLIELLHHRDVIIRKEAARVFVNATSKGSVKQVVYIVEAGAIPPFCQLLSETDSDLPKEALSGLENILRSGKEISHSPDSTVNAYATCIKQCDGIDKITLLSSHANVEIAQKASIIIEKYFLSSCRSLRGMDSSDADCSPVINAVSDEMDSSHE